MNRQNPKVKLVAAFACLMLALAATLTAGGWFGSGRADASLFIEDDTALSDVNPITAQAVLPSMGDDVKVTSIVQRFPIDPRQLGEKRASGRGVVDFTCVDGNGNSRNLGGRNRKFDRYGNLATTRKFPGAFGCGLMSARWTFRGVQRQPASTSINVMTGAQRIVDGADSDCFDKDVLCLNDNRFKIEVDWTTSNRSGAAVLLASGFDTGIFYFFNPDNTELVVKLLDGCEANNHFWLFAAAATDVGYDLTVTDTDTGAVKTYTNPRGTAAPVVTDTTAFATCP
ncbi:MAG: hypothetical protein QF681_11170 [Vicinamibacterales bacterium]|jgi:hypothetical protein|nr:hypothetical protein [Vicinamibacterales bacterium]